MSDVVAAPAETAPTAAPATESAPSAAPPIGTEGALSDAKLRGEQNGPGYRERKAKALAKLTGKAVESPVSAPAVADAPAAEPPAVAEPEAKTEPATEAASESAVDAKESARLARMAVDLKARNAEILKLKQESKAQAEKLEAERAAERAEFAKLKAQLDEFMSNPIAALKPHGGFDAVTKKVLAGELKAPTADDEMREQFAQKLSPLEQKLAEVQAKLEAKERAETEAAQKAEQERVRTNDLGIVKQFVEASTDKYPLVSALGMHENVLQLCYDNQSQDIEAQTAALEEHLATQVSAVMRSPKALARLTKVDPKIRETIEQLAKPAAGQSRKTPVSREEGPRVLARDVVSAPTTPVDRPLTPAERKKRALALLMGS